MLFKQEVESTKRVSFWIHTSHTQSANSMTLRSSLLDNACAAQRMYHAHMITMKDVCCSAASSTLWTEARRTKSTCFELILTMTVDLVLVQRQLFDGLYVATMMCGFVSDIASSDYASIVEARFQTIVVCDESIAVIANPTQLRLHFVRVHPSARAAFRCPAWPLYLSPQMMCALFMQKTSSTTEIASRHALNVESNCRRRHAAARPLHRRRNVANIIVLTSSECCCDSTRTRSSSRCLL